MYFDQVLLDVVCKDEGHSGGGMEGRDVDMVDGGMCYGSKELGGGWMAVWF